FGISVRGSSNPSARIPATIPDGTSNTIFMAEKYAVCGPSGTSQSVFYWGETCLTCGSSGNTSGACNRLANVHTNIGGTGSPPMFYNSTGAAAVLPQIKPIPTSCNPCLLQSSFTGGILVGLGDGSVRLVSQGVTVTTWRNAVRPDDGNPLGNDF